MKWVIRVAICGVSLMSADGWAQEQQCTAAQMEAFPGCLTIDMVNENGVGYSCTCTASDPSKEKHPPVTLQDTDSVSVEVQSPTGTQTCRLVNIGGRLKLICS
jgi:hypothetical protein